MVLFIRILSIKLEKEMFFMKKFMSAILAVIMMFSIAMPVFAAEETTKSVDNTFDNFEPAPGKKAPDNWYDPYCYEADGKMNVQALTADQAYYCKDYKKIFTKGRIGRTSEGYTFYPYEAEGEVSSSDGTITEITTCEYCPYCGILQNYNGQFTSSHERIDGVMLGWFCSSCNEFNARYYLYDVELNTGLNCEMYCYHCESYCKAPTKFYRFISDEQRNADYSFIFTETESQYGDGKDGRIEDIKFSKGGFAKDWDSPDNPHQKLTFWQKIAKFFAKIALWFKNLFK